MLGIHEYGLFVLAGVLLALVPGQDTLFIIGRSITGGLRSGIGAALGVASGCICHTLMAALGLSAILAASPTTVALFFLALLPQFIDPGSTAKTLAFLLLGATFIAIGTIWCLVLAIGAARLRAFFLRRPAFRTLIDRAAGVLFLALGARLAWAR